MMRVAGYGAVAIVVVFGYGASCVDSGSFEQPDDHGVRGALPADDEVIGDDGAPDGGMPGERPVVDDDEVIAHDAGMADGRQRGTLTSGLDLVALRSEIIRQDESIEDVGDEELFLYPGNRAWIYITVANSSDGWVPINFELCTDNAEAVAAIDPDDAALPPEPCRVRFPPGAWPIIEQDDAVEHLTGAVVTLERPAGGYLTIRFRAEFEALGEMDLYEYTVPYRVLPSGQAKGLFTPRRAVLRSLVVDLP